MKKRIGILFGGCSAEHEVSIVSAHSVLRALNLDKYEPILIAVDKQGKWGIFDAQNFQRTDLRHTDLTNIQHRVIPYPYVHNPNLYFLDQPNQHLHIDVFFPLIHGTNGEDGRLQGLLELMQTPYVGCGVLPSALGMDKHISRELFSYHQLPTVPTKVLFYSLFLQKPHVYIQDAIQTLGLPMFIKPASLGSSIGVQKIKTQTEAYDKIQQAFQYEHKVLLEKAIHAREIECAVLGNENPQASVLGEIIPQHEFYDYEAKYLDQNGAILDAPAKNISDSLVEDIQKIAKKAYQIIGAQGMCRVDFFLDKKSNALYLNEVNTVPGFTDISMYPKLWQLSGLTYPQLIDALIQFAVEKFEAQKNLKITL